MTVPFFATKNFRHGRLGSCGPEPRHLVDCRRPPLTCHVRFTWVLNMFAEA